MGILRAWGREPAERSYGRGSIEVSDAGVGERLRFLGVTEEELGVMMAWQGPCRAACDAMIDAFYAHIARSPEPQAIIERHTTVERQRPLVTRYVLAMFSGRIDDEYVEYRRRVGAVHERIDLDSNWFVAMYEVIREHMLAAVRDAGATRAEQERFARAFGRLLHADIALVVTALTDARLGRVEEALRGESMRFLEEVGEALARVADRDLGVRIVGRYSGKNEEIRRAFNDSLAVLEDTLREVAEAAERSRPPRSRSAPGPASSPAERETRPRAWRT